MYALPDKTIKEIRLLLEDISTNYKDDIQFITEQYGINLFIDTNTKGLLNSLYSTVNKRLLENPSIKFIFQEFEKNEATEHTEKHKYIHNEIINNHYRAYTIIKELHPIILFKLRHFKNHILWNALYGLPIEIKPLSELYLMFINNPVELDEYLNKFTWEKTQENFKDVQKLKKHFLEIRNILEKYRMNHYNIHELYYLDEITLNNKLQTHK